jgi:oxygen-independent coproporphyrinogen-3 oxidase
MKSAIPEKEYIAHLLNDLDADLAFVQGRHLHSIFIGGGTPSLLSEQAVDTLLTGIEKRIPFSENIEITLEANPGTLEYNKFDGFAKAGINRISIGVQSFQQEKLTQLGRIHSSDEAKKAAEYAEKAVGNFNIDLMHGLPNQSVQDAESDLNLALALNPTHLSWYQLTIEPNTLFYSKPPALPHDDILWDIHQAGQSILSQAGYQQYEVSAYAKGEKRSEHNLNYWRFGDYLGIGCGAHGKITLANQLTLLRTEKIKHPKGYMDLTKTYLNKQWEVDKDDLPFEFFMNRFRVKESFHIDEYEKLTLRSSKDIKKGIERAQKEGFITINNDIITITQQGHEFYNNLVDIFL